jgi:hypothetical protein
MAIMITVNRMYLPFRLATRFSVSRVHPHALFDVSERALLPLDGIGIEAPFCQREIRYDIRASLFHV